MKYKYFYDSQLKDVVNKSGLSTIRYYLLDYYSHRFTNLLIKNGNRRAAMATFLKMLIFLKKLTFSSPVRFLRTALLNLMSIVTIRTLYRGRRVIRKGSFNKPSVRLTLALRLLYKIINHFRTQLPNMEEHQVLAIGVLNSYFEYGPVFKDLRISHLIFGRGKKRSIMRMNVRRGKRPFKIRFRRTKKTRGFYYLKRYGLYKRIQML